MKAISYLNPDLLEMTHQVLPVASVTDGAYLKGLMESLAATLRQCRHHPEVLRHYVPLIETLVFGFDGSGVLEALDVSQARFAEFNDAYCAWETALELDFTRSARPGAQLDMSSYALNLRFERLLRREVSLLTGPLQDRRVLFIGSGPVPISAIWLNRLMGVKVDCVDANPSAIEASRKLIAALGLSDQIWMFQSTGESFDVSPYDIILIALLAKPKNLILQNIHLAAPDDCQVICRTSHGLRQLLYEPTRFDADLLQHFTFEDERVVVGSCDDTISSALLRKLAWSEKRRARP